MRRPIAALSILGSLSAAATIYAASSLSYAPLATPSDNATSVWYDPSQPAGQRDRNISLSTLKSIIATAGIDSSGLVPNTRTINGHALTGPVVITPSDLVQDNTHRFVSDAEKTAWNAKQGPLVAGTDYATPASVTAKQDTLVNASTLVKITESNGSPLWNGGAWPGGTGGSNLIAGVDYATPAAVAAKQDALGFTPPPNTRTINGHALTSDVVVAPADLAQTSAYRFVSDVEKAAWNGKQNTLVAGLDYATPDAVAAKQNALGFTPPPNTRTVNGHALTADVVIAPADLAQSATYRFTTDTEKATWNGKLNAANPTHTGTMTGPGYSSNAADGTHYVLPFNSVAFSGTPALGMIQTTASGAQWYNGTAWTAIGGGGTWGSITGTLSSQSDLNTALAAKAPIASPTFTGTATAPLFASNAGNGGYFARITNTSAPTYASPEKGDFAYNSTLDRAVVHNGSNWTSWYLLKNTDVMGTYAPIASPTFTGTATAPLFASNAGNGGYFARITNTSAPTYASPEKGDFAYNSTLDRAVVHNGSNWTSWYLLKNTDVGTIAALNTGTLTNGNYCTYVTGTGIVCNSAGTGSQSFPAAGIMVSTGSAFGTSLTAPSGAIVGTTDTQTMSGKTLTSPVINGATGTGLVATGIVSGASPITITTTTPVTVGGTYQNEYVFNNNATAAAAQVYNLPTASAGRQVCVKQYTGRTGTIRVNTSASGQYIDVDGTNSASGGYVISGGAAGDGACFVGADATHWVMYHNKGTWTRN